MELHFTQPPITFKTIIKWTLIVLVMFPLFAIAQSLFFFLLGNGIAFVIDILSEMVDELVHLL